MILNTVYNSTWNGIWLVNSPYNDLSNNTVYNNEHGISLTSSWDNDIKHNFVTNNSKQGIGTYNSSFTYIYDNILHKNAWKRVL